jgi:hypothetical protein
MTGRSIDKATLIDWLGDGPELAVLDIRPVDEVGYALPLFATNLPAEKQLAASRATTARAFRQRTL